jgi:diguanylate cyclase (GGDEF)-like protein
MPTKNHLYKKVLDTAPFGTVFFAYGVCIDANAQALSILKCERAQIIGAAIAEDQDHQLQSIQQLKQVVRKLQDNQLKGILWRTENTLQHDEVVVSTGSVEDADGVLCLMLYPLPSLAQMVVKEFVTEDLIAVETSEKTAGKITEKTEQESPAPLKVPSKELTNEPSQDQATQQIDEELPAATIPTTGENLEPKIYNSPSDLLESIQSDQYETLAGLPVSPRLIESISIYLDNSREDSPCGTLLLIDFDHFNSINESLGKQVGNQILERAAESIQGLCTELMEVDQVAGDSFLLFVKDIADTAEQAREVSLAIANEIRCIITRPFFTESGEVSVTASVGISVLYAGIYYPSTDSLSNAEEAVQQAESAMFEAKRRGRDTVVLFDSQITRQARQRINMQSSLRKAVTNQEFDIYVQPQVSTHSGEVVGGEVLLRWMNSGQARHSPADFIPILESSGMIVDVGLWVIRTSCEYLRNMLDRGLWDESMQMAVNISPKQFHDPHLIKSLEHSLKSYDIRPDMLTLEVTENLLIDDFESVAEKMKKIRNMGTRFAIDDFGSGYSSMIYLKRLPLDILKIDREFITNLNSDKETLGLVEAIMMVAHHYGLDVVAEGVEKREVLDILRSLGCEKYQGAHFSMPVSLDKFQRLLVA